MGIDTTHKAQFNGDIGQPPYQLELLIKSGPSSLLRANLIAGVTDSTTGLLAPRDVRHVLGTGGTLALQLACSPGGDYRVVRIGRRLPGTAAGAQ
jgi:hypothetical protein